MRFGSVYAGEWLTPPPSSPRRSRGTTQTRNLLTRRRRNIYLHFCFWYRCRSVRFPGENIRVRDSSEGRNPEKRRLSRANSISQTLRSRTVQTTRKWFSGRWFHRDPLLRCYKIAETRQKWLVFFILDSFISFKTLRWRIQTYKTTTMECSTRIFREKYYYKRSRKSIIFKIIP